MPPTRIVTPRGVSRGAQPRRFPSSLRQILQRLINKQSPCQPASHPFSRNETCGRVHTATDWAAAQSPRTRLRGWQSGSKHNSDGSCFFYPLKPIHRRFLKSLDLPRRSVAEHHMAVNLKTKDVAPPSFDLHHY